MLGQHQQRSQGATEALEPQGVLDGTIQQSRVRREPFFQRGDAETSQRLGRRRRRRRARRRHVAGEREAAIQSVDPSPLATLGRLPNVRKRLRDLALVVATLQGRRRRRERLRALRRRRDVLARRRVDQEVIARGVGRRPDLPQRHAEDDRHVGFIKGQQRVNAQGALPPEHELEPPDVLERALAARARREGAAPEPQRAAAPLVGAGSRGHGDEQELLLRRGRFDGVLLCGGPDDVRQAPALQEGRRPRRPSQRLRAAKETLRNVGVVQGRRELDARGRAGARRVLRVLRRAARREHVELRADVGTRIAAQRDVRTEIGRLFIKSRRHRRPAGQQRIREAIQNQAGVPGHAGDRAPRAVDVLAGPHAADRAGLGSQRGRPARGGPLVERPRRGVGREPGGLRVGEAQRRAELAPHLRCARRAEARGLL
mmetsp:Transcript_22470/g.58468  ORF Transcript_22470/g.58468 Transcript_22470/m.58468 type:complete len:429 (+) Transcript_22470:501-1787(+)